MSDKFNFFIHQFDAAQQLAPAGIKVIEPSPSLLASATLAQARREHEKCIDREEIDLRKALREVGFA